ncbi:MAG: hypothetical protein IPJ58_06405 [Ardenticatenia bacterium]|nr:hypothetical protein [Ardenticatenia bacterium]
MSIDPRVGIALIVVCIVTFILVERDRQRRIGRVKPMAPRSVPEATEESDTSEATGSDEPPREA